MKEFLAKIWKNKEVCPWASRRIFTDLQQKFQIAAKFLIKQQVYYQCFLKFFEPIILGLLFLNHDPDQA